MSKGRVSLLLMGKGGGGGGGGLGIEDHDWDERFGGFPFLQPNMYVSEGYVCDVMCDV